MDFLIGYLQQGLSYIIPLIILLGLLIFVHELGHFLVAKYYGVRVEVFSLGFGRKLLSWKRGDTNYCISLIPFGGYVKMYGDEPGVEIPEDQKKFSFTHKPVGHRFAVVAAGPLMNLFFAALLFVIIAVVGETMLQPIVGEVEVGTPAEKSGFKYGDTILKINNSAVESWDQIKKSIEDSAGTNLPIQVKRFHSDEIVVLNSKVEEVANRNILSSRETVGEIEGLSPFSRASVVGVPTPKSLAGEAGFKTGDEIKSINNSEIRTWTELLLVLGQVQNEKLFEVQISREEGKTQKVINLKFDSPSLAKASPEKILEIWGLESPDLYVKAIEKSSPAAAAGIQTGDRIVRINDKTLKNWDELVLVVGNYTPEQPALKINVDRAGEIFDVTVAPKMIKQMSQTGKDESRYVLGITTSSRLAQPPTFISRITSPTKALLRGVDQTIHWTQTTVISFLRLIQHQVSAKSIGGPIMIGQLASETFKIGLSPFLKIMAIISINLFILNLLPVPVLDGGHLVFFSIEIIKGAPLSMRKMEIAQQVGLVLLMGLMAFALYNDLSRLIGVSW